MMHLVRTTLAVGFVTPMFVGAGLLLASIPIIIHLLNRRRFKTVDWAAMDFLLRAMRKNRRRVRFEQWLLLAVRCSVLCLLGLALARPLGCEDTSIAALAARRSGLHVIVIDNSYSMSYEADRPAAKTHLDQAKLLAKQLIDRFTSGGESIAIITAGQPAASLIAAPVFDPVVAKSAVDRIEQGYGATDLSGALELAGKIARDETRQPNKFLYLFTDSTRSAWQNQKSEQSLQSTGRELAKLYEHIAHFDLSRAGQSNAAILDVHGGSKLLRLGFSNNDLVARVAGYGATREGLLQWRWDDQLLLGAANIRPDGETDITQSNVQLGRGGLHVVSASFAGDDRIKIDDTRTRVIDVASEMKVLVVEGERSAEALGGSAALVMEALAPRAVDPAANPNNKPTGYLAPEVVSDLEFGGKVVHDYRAVVLAGVGQISANSADQLKQFVEAGGTLMIFMGEPVSSENYNTVLLPRGLLPGPLAKRITAGGGREPFFLDFKPEQTHSLLHKFARMPNTGLERAPIYSYWQIDLPRDGKAEHVLDFQKTDNRVDPAVVLHSLGAGHVITFATGASLDWTALPARLNFAPLLHELLSGTMSSGDEWMNLSVGQELRIPARVQLTSAPVLKDPQQADLVMEQATSPGGQITYHSRPIMKPGLYTLITGNTKMPIAVNVPSAGENETPEADIRPIDQNAIRKALGDIEIAFERDQLPAAADRNSAGNDFGWSMMMIVLGVVGLECFLAMRFGHYRRT
jgi:Mg-chelatase subunit ChlD